MLDFSFDKTLTDPKIISEYLLNMRKLKAPGLRRAVNFYSLDWLVTWDGERYNVYKCKCASFGKVKLPLKSIEEN